MSIYSHLSLIRFSSLDLSLFLKFYASFNVENSDFFKIFKYICFYFLFVYTFEAKWRSAKIQNVFTHFPEYINRQNQFLIKIIPVFHRLKYQCTKYKSINNIQLQICTFCWTIWQVSCQEGQLEKISYPLLVEMVTWAKLEKSYSHTELMLTQLIRISRYSES